MKKNRNSQSQKKLKDHDFIDKKLIPPLAQLNMTPSSWIDDRLPEMLWAALLSEEFGREDRLKRFEHVVDVACGEIDFGDKDWRDKPLAVTLTGISKLDSGKQSRIIRAIAQDDKAIKTLTPMLFFDNLPAKAAWEKVLKVDHKAKELNKLARAISICFSHQSQEATDCRWVKVLYCVKLGLITFTSKVRETPKNILEYPAHNEEQLRRSRPSVRSLEIGLGITNNKSKWPEQFWKECYEKTQCFPRSVSEEEIKKSYPSKEELEENRKKLGEINQNLTDHFWRTMINSDKDPKHEIIFGIALYAGDLAVSSILLGAGKTSLSRLTLRTLVECLITLKFLVTKDEPELWEAFQSHGTGQAKLVVQRSEEEKRNPQYLDTKNLGQIANDDKWVEFLPIDIGDWDDSNLRSKAIEVDLKDFYDDYYTWGSSYSHGQWGAIRESVIDLCGNPLHRFHRIPLLCPFLLKDSCDDIFLLLTKIVDIVYEIYPDSNSNKSSS